MCAQVDPERGGLDSLSKRLHMKPELLQELLELFYTRNSSNEGGGSQEKYERSAMKKELMLAYVLVLVQVRNGDGWRVRPVRGGSSAWKAYWAGDPLVRSQRNA